MLNYSSFSHLSFDCYGTLIDWESGILAAVDKVLQRHRVDLQPAEIIRSYAGFEAEIEAGDFVAYRHVLRGVMNRFAREFGFLPTEDDLQALPESVGRWPAFPDTVQALARLAKRYRLVILSNIDDAMFAETREALGVEFEDIVTAEQIGSYKPSTRHFEVALDRLGIRSGQLLHVAQSLYHDHVPAQRLGLKTAWVNRQSRCPGVGVAPVARVVPDVEVADLDGLADLAGV